MTSRILVVFCLVAVAIVAPACGKKGPSAEEIDNTLQGKLPALEGGAASIRGVPLLAPKVVARFYKERNSKHAWDGEDAADIVRAVREIRADGLDPSDYHLEALEKVLQEREKSTSPALEADLDILLSDAVAGMVDHVRYGRVRPVTLNPSWNVDPREEAPPREKEVARIAGERSAWEAIEGAKPNHFIYRGLKGALAHLYDVVGKGGWPKVPPGKPIRPGATDPRIPAVRARLAATGEVRDASDASTVYDDELRKAVELFQARHRLDQDGIIDKDVVDAMNVSAENRADQVRVNLERARWVLPALGDEFMLVNLPAFKAYLIKGDKNVWEARTQIGQEGKQTPSFGALMRTVVFNPDWTVPPTILREEIIPAMHKDRSYLSRKGLVVVDDKGHEIDPGSIGWNSDEALNYTVKQPPGPDNALGRVKFLFPNPYSIYLHDTPSKASFDAEKRTFSHGCIRLEHPLELAERVLSWNQSKIQDALEGGETMNVTIDPPLPVVIVYWTVSVGASGEIRYMRDIYGLDPPVLAALNRPLGR